LTCSHAPRLIQYQGGEAHLSANGTWWATRKTPTGLVVESLTKCPGCSVQLWGLPPEALHRGDHL
jgi:hypothetical protein